MTTLKSIVRPSNASYKSSARQIERQSKEIAKHCQQKLKQQVAVHDNAAINTYSEYIDMLLSVHEECSEPLDWDSFTTEHKPKEPVFWPLWENEARFDLKRFEPSFLDIITGQARWKIRRLRKKLEEARAEDLEVHLFNQKNYKKNKDDWELIQSLRDGIKNANPSAYETAIDFFDPYAKITHLGSSLIYDIHSDHLRINVYIDSTAIIPDYILTGTVNGDMISTKLSPERFNKIYIDYICSCALLLARETFALLPVQHVYVNVMQRPLNALVNNDTENNAILSVKFNPDVVKQENKQALRCLKVLINIPGAVPFAILNNLPNISRMTNQGDLASF